MFPSLGENFSHPETGNNFLKLRVFLFLSQPFHSPQFCFPAHQPWLTGLLFCLGLAVLLIRVYHMGTIKRIRVWFGKEKGGKIWVSFRGSVTEWHPREGRQGLWTWDMKNGNPLALTQGLVTAILTTIPRTPPKWKSLWVFQLSKSLLALKWAIFFWKPWPSFGSEGISVGLKGFLTAILPVRAIAKGAISY